VGQRLPSIAISAGILSGNTSGSLSLQLRIINRRLVDITQVMRVWLVWHDAYTVATEVIATEVSIKIDVFPEASHQLTSLIELGKGLRSWLLITLFQPPPE
jgi:hypothetical protein